MKRTTPFIAIVLVLAFGLLAAPGGLYGAESAPAGTFPFNDLDALYQTPANRSLLFSLDQPRNAPAPVVDNIGGVRVSDGGKLDSLSAPAVSPGVIAQSASPSLEIFVGLVQQKYRPDPRFKFIAYISGGKPAIAPAQGTVEFAAMEKPWLLAWRANKELSAEQPVLVLCQNPIKTVECLPDRWKIQFQDKAGTVVLMPLSGAITHVTEKWAEGLPEEIVARADGWARRMRRIPVAVHQTWAAEGNVFRFTDTFEYLDVEDAWKTPRQPWAFLPPIVGLSKATKGPVEVEGAAEDVPWLGSLGPIIATSGKDSITYRIKIPRLAEYIEKPPVAPAADAIARLENESPKFKVLLGRVRKEIGKLLDANDHLAPFAFYSGAHRFGRPGLDYYWGSPAETIQTLVWALPFVEPAKTEAFKKYIEDEYRRYPPIEWSWTPVSVGVRREYYDWDFAGGQKQVQPPKPAPNLGGVYAAWEYCDKVAGKDAALALWSQAKKLIEDDLKKAPFTWSRVETAATTPDGRINAYLGAARFAALAQDKEWDTFLRCLLARALVVKHAQLYYQQYLIDHGTERGIQSPPYPEKLFNDNDKFRGTEAGVFNRDKEGEGARHLEFGESYGLYGQRVAFLGFRGITPETGEFLHDHCRDAVTVLVNYRRWAYPGHWLSRSGRLWANGEEQNIQPWVPWASFLALALGAQAPPDELAWSVGDSIAKLGDLYYIQKLAFTLRAFTLAGEQKR